MTVRANIGVTMDFQQNNPLFVFEMANNHMGNVEHGLKIIRDIYQVSKDFSFRFAFKFQYRHLDSFIHPDFKSRSDIKYVKRFSETRLNEEHFRLLKNEVTDLGFLSVCTPFDEKSVDLIEKHGFDVIKIASCSFTDWPLLERVVRTGKPIIASTAGVSLEDIDKVVAFFEHRQRNFALMHCVARYPTENRDIQLNQIDLLRSRYPQIRVGFSTHERPDNIDTIKLAVSKGVSLFEKHVGSPAPGVTLNDYSATPAQIALWLEAASQAFEMCGVTEKRMDFSDEELNSLCSLRRGVFARRPIKKNEKITMKDLFLAIPLTTGQLSANDLSKYAEFHAQQKIDANKPIMIADVKKIDIREKIYDSVNRVRTLLLENNIVTPGKADFEISHHYGIDNFKEFGSTMITVINRDYCKKLIIMLPGQKHPEQYHKIKEETFYILCGGVTIKLDNEEKEYHKGDIVVVEKGVRHSFSSKTGAVIEEISSTHFKNDSHYTDPAINKNKNRKTWLTYWMD